MKPENKKSTSPLMLIITTIIILQSLMIILTGINKVGFHIDENYSYILSNSYDSDRISNADWMWGSWIDETDFNEFTTVQSNERFSFSSVYKNNSTDCHPPLFYWTLHAICSIFPNTFNKWHGILLNVFYFIITEYFLWLISKELIASDKLKILPVVLYGFSWLALDTCIFIRMYMMLTMFTVIFSYVQTKLLKYGITVKRLIVNAIVIYSGAMTQYYFVVFAFFAVISLALYLLSKKRTKVALTYWGTSFFAVLLMVASYPFVLTQATGSSTNNIGNEITKNLFNFKLWGYQIIKLFNSTAHQLAFNLRLVGILVTAVICLLITLVVVRKRQHEAIVWPLKKCFVWLTISLAMFYLAITFIGGDYVYTRYIYMIIPLCYLLLVMIFDILMSQYTKMQTVTMIVCVTFAITNAIMIYKNDQCTYLFQGNEKLAQQFTQYDNEKLLVIVKNKSTVIPTSNYWLFKAFKSVYMDTSDNIEKSREFEKCLENNDNFIVYIAQSGYWVEGFNPKELLEKYRNNNKFEFDLLAETQFGSYYQIRKKKT